MMAKLCNMICFDSISIGFRFVIGLSAEIDFQFALPRRLSLKHRGHAGYSGPMISDRLRTLLLKPSTRVCVLTGAGVSQESGVPTFRDKNGLWQKFRPEELANMSAFLANPKLVWEW